MSSKRVAKKRKVGGNTDNIESITMPGENPLNTPEQPSQKTETISASFESLSALEAMSAKELSIRKQQIEAKIGKLRELDKQQALAKGGNIYTQSSESDTLIQARNEESLIDKAIQKKAQTIQDVFHDDTISYTPQDVLELYKRLEPTSQTNDPQSAYESLQGQVDIAKDGSKEGWSLDEILEKLKIPKDNQKYRKIVARAFIGEQLDTTESSAIVANTTFDALQRGIEELSPTEKITLTTIADRLTGNNALLFDQKNIIQVIGSGENYQQMRESALKGLGIDISEDEYNILVGSATRINTDANEATARAQENKDIQIAALEKGNLVEALQQETKYQRETSQIEYYRDLRSSLSKTEGSKTNNNPPAFRNGINVNEANFSQNLEYFMNDERTNSIYPKLSDGTTIPIIKAGDDVYIVQGCQVPADEVEGLVKLNQTLAENGLRFFSTTSPLTKILSRIEQTLRIKGVQNIPQFGDFKNIGTYQDNIVDILYALIDPEPKTPSPNVNERINLTSKRLKTGIPLIAHGRQSGIVKEDSSIDLDKITEKLTVMVQSGYPFMFGGKSEKYSENTP